MKVFKKILNVIADVFIVLVLFVSIITIIANANYNQDKMCSEFFGYTFLSNQTDSMYPEIKPGDFLVCKLVDEDMEFEEGDIISFLENKGGDIGWVITTHEIKEVGDINGPVYYTWGINEEATGGHMDNGYRLRSDIIAKYKFKIPKLGAFLDFLKKPLGFVLCIILPIVLVIGVQVFKIASISIEEKKKEFVAAAQDSTSEEVKDAIIKEYLEKQKQLQQAEEHKDVEEK